MFSFKINCDLVLRLLEERHAEKLFDLLNQNREHLSTGITWLNADYNLTDTRKFIKNALEQFAANKGIRAGIWYRDNLAGVIGLHSIIWSDRRASIGYFLGASFQGKGIATETCRVLVDYSFQELKLNRLEIQCSSENQGSRKIPERLGFVQEGVLRKAEWLHDHLVDLAVYGILADEWQSGNKITKNTKKKKQLETTDDIKPVVGV